MRQYSLVLACFTAMAAFAIPTPNEKKTCRAGIRHIESGGIGYEDGYTTLEGFFSPDPNLWAVMPFLDARAHVSDNGKWAANAGIGLRTIWENRAYGINGYYDYRSTQRMHSNQFGLGLETLGTLFDFRINGYFPLGKKVSQSWDPAFGAFSGNQMLVSQKHQFAMTGVDAEFGFHLGKWKHFDFYTAAGPYYFRGDLGSNVWGGKARVAGMYKEFVGLELSNSYDTTFHNRLQGQISLSFSFGPTAKKACRPLNMAQPVIRQEIIVMDTQRKNTVAIDPATGLPFFFVFVDNTSSSNGTYESPYHTFAQVEANSSPGDVIYVFPGDGTTRGMNSGITLKANQKFWGSGVSHGIQTAAGTISIPAQTSTSPTITNTDINTSGDAVTLATNNAISGFTISSAMNDAIFGANPQSLEVSSCTFTNTTTFTIEASFSGNASVSVTNNQFLNNTNGISLTFNGTSTVVCSGNTFEGQTSISEVPLGIAANNNVLTATIDRNVFHGNITGSIRCAFTNVVDANINVLNNAMTNNGTGSQASLGSSFAVVPSGTTNNCSLAFTGNTFSGNTSNSAYLHTSGAFTTLAVTVSENTMSNNGGSALVIATPVNALTVLAIDNTISGLGDNGIALIASGTTSTGHITITNNTLTHIGNASNGIAVNQDFTTLNLTTSNNQINGCEGTGILSFAPTGINSLTLDISGNAISNCQNLSSNASSGIDIEEYTSLVGSVTNNTLTSNTSPAVAIGSVLTAPTACLTLSGNSSTDYLLSNPMDGTFNLSPCNVDSVNTGMINTSGTINSVQSCPGAAPCPP